MLERRPRTGYEIKRIVDQSTRFFWAASYGQIYPELERLAQAGLIEGTGEPHGGRRRNVYRLTSTGKAALRRWLREPEVPLEIRDAGLLKLFFSGAVGVDDRIQLLRAIGSARAATLDRLREIEREGKAPPGSSGELVLQYGIGHYEWMVDWCSRMERRLQRLEVELGCSRGWPRPSRSR